MGLAGVLHAAGATPEAFDLDGEYTVPAFFSAGLLAVAAAMALALARAQDGIDRDASALAGRSPSGSSALDELLSIHERVDIRTDVDWQVLYLPAAIGFGWAIWRVTGSLGRRGLESRMIFAGLGAWVAAQMLEAAVYSEVTPSLVDESMSSSRDRRRHSLAAVLRALDTRGAARDGRIAASGSRACGRGEPHRRPARTNMPRPMSETETSSLKTKQADREASGARPYGRYLEDFEVGAVYEHWPAKTVTEADDHLFCLMTMNHHPLHINDVYAAESQQGRNVVVGPLVYSLALGMSVADVSGKAIANLATEELSHPAPVFHGDTLFAESEVLEVRPSQSKPDRGIVKVHTRVHKQDGTLVAEFKRAVLVPRR